MTKTATVANELVHITPKDEEAIRRPASEIIALARDFRVVNQETYETAGEHLKRVKGAQKELDAKKTGIMGPLKAAVKAVSALFAGPEAELAEAEGLFKRSMIAYADDQERLRKEEQRKLDDKAQRERERIVREQREAEELARQARESGNVKQAEKLEAKSDRLSDAAASVVPAVVQREAPRVAGVSTRENWYAVVIDLKALVAAIAEGKVPITAVEANMKFLNNQAKALKRELAYPGVQPARETIMASGSK